MQSAQDVALPWFGKNDDDAKMTQLMILTQMLSKWTAAIYPPTCILNMLIRRHNLEQFITELSSFVLYIEKQHAQNI